MSTTITQQTRTRILALAGLFFAAGLGSSAVGLPPSLRDGLLVIASVIAGVPILVRAAQALRYRAFSIDLLVTIAVIGALIIGEYLESAAVAVLFLFGAWLEARTLARTRASLRELIDLAPAQATVIRDGERLVVSVEDVELGETVVVVNGELIAVDGVVSAGSAEVSEASITGEAIPVTKSVGERVFAGSLLETGFLEVTAEQVGDDTVVSRMIEFVEEAQESKTRRQRFLDRFAQIYTPAVIVLAVVTLIWTRDLSNALTFLVIACPGALVISVPVAAVAGLGNLARHGVLIKDGEALEELAAANVLVADKTGTLTVGKPVVTNVFVASTYSEAELVALAATVESASEHHLARAIVEHARSAGQFVEHKLSEIEILTGVGVRALVNGQQVVVGRRTFVEERAGAVTRELAAKATEFEHQGGSVVFVAVGDKPVGIIAVADAVRRDVELGLTQLRASGIDRIVMLTGDNEHAARVVAEQLGIDEFYSGLLPEDKAEKITELQHNGARVAMLGDGVNDALALSLASVGIAMGDTGTDISVESADVVLLTDRFEHLAHARRVARFTVRVMRQNTVLALGTVLLLLAGVLFQVVHLAEGMLVHEASVLLVILNAIRITAMREPTHH